MFFNRFDICEAYYLYAMLWHGGQWSEDYKLFSKLANCSFKPKLNLRSEDDLSENGRYIYNAILERKGLNNG